MALGICCAYNLYFIFLLPGVELFYLLYLDFLILCVLLLFFCLDILRRKNRIRKKKALLRQGYLICQEFEDVEDSDIMAHDIGILEGQLQEQFQMNCELQDYIAKWCHEVKIPLAAALLMTDEIKEQHMKKSMQEQLEKINLQLRTALLGAKAQSSLFDLQIRKTSLAKCVRASVHNNQFFLIQHHFAIQLQIEEDVFVYTDISWLTYVLDQLISNSVKYARKSPTLIIDCHKEEDKTLLCVEDNGEGIKQSDIRRIFEKGYVGSNCHNGKYQSTGMGLYMVSVILGRLGHGISVESEYGKGCRFVIVFSDNREYFYQ